MENMEDNVVYTEEQRIEEGALIPAENNGHSGSSAIPMLIGAGLTMAVGAAWKYGIKPIVRKIKNAGKAKKASAEREYIVPEDANDKSADDDNE